jgi:predicted nucleic acid-binding protein
VSAVVSDASPLINLARVGRFDLLTAFYGRIAIPQAVYDEVVVRGQRRDGSREIKDASWIEVHVPQGELAVRALAAELGRSRDVTKMRYHRCSSIACEHPWSRCGPGG